jgi:hypothetical protein
MNDKTAQALGNLLSGMSPKSMSSFLNLYGTTLLESFLISVMEAMPLEALKEFEKVIEEGDEKDIEAFLRREVPDMNERLESELDRLEKMYADAAKALDI